MIARDSRSNRATDPICQSDILLQLRELSDEQLVSNALSKPKEGRYLLCLDCRHRPLVESIVGSSPQSKVMAATVWIQVRRRLERLNTQESKFLSWLTVLSADTLAQILRGNQKLLTNSTTENPVVMGYLDSALQQLPPPERFVLVLHDVYQWSLPQIKSWMNDQQWSVQLEHLEDSLNQARDFVIDTLPLDLRNICWPPQAMLGEQLCTALQGLEFDLEGERRSFGQWYTQQGNKPEKNLLGSLAGDNPEQAGGRFHLPSQVLWASGIVGMIGIGSFIGYQGVNILSNNLSSSPTEVAALNMPVAPQATQKQPKPVVIATRPVASIAPKPVIVEKPKPEPVAPVLAEKPPEPKFVAPALEKPKVRPPTPRPVVVGAALAEPKPQVIALNAAPPLEKVVAPKPKTIIAVTPKRKARVKPPQVTPVLAETPQSPKPVWKPKKQKVPLVVAQTPAPKPVAPKKVKVKPVERVAFKSPTMPSSGAGVSRVYIVARNASEGVALKRKFPGAVTRPCGKGICLQVGAFKAGVNAAALCDKLNAQGFRTVKNSAS